MTVDAQRVSQYKIIAYIVEIPTFIDIDQGIHEFKIQIGGIGAHLRDNIGLRRTGGGHHTVQDILFGPAI